MLITGTSLSYCAKRCSVINTNIDARKWEVTVHSVTSNTLRDAQTVSYTHLTLPTTERV